MDVLQVIERKVVAAFDIFYILSPRLLSSLMREMGSRDSRVRCGILIPPPPKLSGDENDDQILGEELGVQRASPQTLAPARPLPDSDDADNGVPSRRFLSIMNDVRRNGDGTLLRTSGSSCNTEARYRDHC